MEPVRPPGEADQATSEDGPTSPGRRDFVRALGREGVRSAGHITGAMSAISGVPLSLGAELLGLRPTGDGSPGPVPSSRPAARPDAAPGASSTDPTDGVRPWRMAGTSLVVLDQRELPSVRRELPLDSAAAVAASLDTLATPFGMALGEIASWGVAMAARAAADQPSSEQRRSLGWNIRLLRSGRPSSAAVGVALARQETVLDGLPSEADSRLVADAFAEEAAAFAAHTSAVSETLSSRAMELLTLVRGDADASGAATPHDARPHRPLRLLTLGAGGALSGGGGTVTAVMSALATRPGGIQAWVAETRPSLVGTRCTASELARSEIPVTVLADGAVGALLSTLPMDLLLVTAERMDVDGELLAVAGTYPAALLAARHGVPVCVVGPSWLADRQTAQAMPRPLPSRSAHELITIAGVRLTPGPADGYVPLLDRTPADLVSGFLSERGLVRR